MKRSRGQGGCWWVLPGYSGSHFGLFRLIEGDTPDIDPGSPAECPELHAHFASVLQLLLAGVVDELKDARLDIAAAVEQCARQRLRAPSAVRRIERFVGEVTPLAVDAKAIAPWLMLFGQRLLAGLAVGDHDAVVAAPIVVAPWLAWKASIVVPDRKLL